MPNVPVTNVRTSHALSIRANGVTVGLINSWNPTQSRGAVHVFEVDSSNSGNPVEIVPGNISGLTISISRYDVYLKRMEEAFETPDLVMLTRQNQPFDILEVWVLPDNNLQASQGGPSIFTQQERFVYRNCWFTSLGRTLRSDDNRIVNANATIMYTQKLKVTGLTAPILTL